MADGEIAWGGFWGYGSWALGFLEHARGRLADLGRQGLMRSPRTVESAQGPEFVVDGRRALCLCSNNYLGFADHPDIKAAASRALAEFGFGACASRHITGSFSVHVAAERRIARYVDLPRALFFATGYAANVGVLQGLADSQTLILSDALNHASLIDGCRLSGAAVRVYRHCDVAHVAELLREERANYASALLVTESLFSMDGDFAPVVALRELCDAMDVALVVDEAHALGVIGPAGRGLCAREQVRPDVMTGTFGKAFGASGAFVAGPEPVVRLVENRARSYVFSTAPSPAVPAAAIAAIDLVEHADRERERVLHHARSLRDGLWALGYQVLDAEAQILPVLLGSAHAATELSARLLELGVFVHAIRPPTVAPGTSRLRITPMASHEPQQIARALEAFRDARP